MTILLSLPLGAIGSALLGFLVFRLYFRIRRLQHLRTLGPPVTVLEIEGQSFRDLNGNGVLNYVTLGRKTMLKDSQRQLVHAVTRRGSKVL